MNNTHDNTNKSICNKRRNFLLAGTTTIISSFLPELNASVDIEIQKYPRKKLIDIKDIQQDIPLYFSYPYDEENSFIVKLGEAAGGGIGEQNDIVAFNQFCTHMGAPMQGTYKKIEKILGACPMHLTTFDLTRHGMVVSGHATDSLPQVVLEVKDNAIYAVGISGLIYGHSHNLEKEAQNV
jgi:arsenite oxidase small subunit